jgi:hypothetical protein
LTEGFLAHTAKVWMFSIMFMLMGNETHLLAEGFITHIGMVQMVSTLYILTSLKVTLKTKTFLITQNSF